MPLAYLSSSRKDLDVIELISVEALGRRSLDEICREKQRELIDRLRSGAYAVTGVGVPAAWGGKLIEDTVRSSFPPEQVQQWEILNRDGGVALIVYRLKDDPASLAAMRSGSELAEGATHIQR